MHRHTPHHNRLLYSKINFKLVYRLYTEMEDEEEAASAYTLLVKETEGSPFSKEHADAYKYLAYHHLKLGQFHLAFQFAQLCLNFEEVRIRFL